MSQRGSRSARQRLIALGGLGVIVGAAVILLLLLDVLGTSSDVDAVELLDTPPPDAGTAVTEVGPEKGKLAPDFEISDFDNVRFRLSEFRGQVVYINFWATWCVPCQKELPDIAVLQEEYGDQLVVITVNRREPVDRARSYFESIPNLDGGAGVSFPVNGLDPDDTLYERYRGLGMPTSIFVAADGVVTDRADGIISLEDMRAAVARAQESG